MHLRVRYLQVKKEQREIEEDADLKMKKIKFR